MQNSKTFSFLHFPSFRKNCVFCINILSLDVNHRPFLSLSLSLFLSLLFFLLSVSSYQNNPIQKLAPPRKKIHPQKQSTYVTNHPSNSLAVRAGKSRKTSPPPSLSLSPHDSACSRKESGAKRKRDRLKIHGRL